MNTQYRAAEFDIYCDKGAAVEPFKAICKDKSGAVVNITGWTAKAEVRKTYGSPVLIDIAPQVSNGAAGEITFAIAGSKSASLRAGTYLWDLILIDSSGETYGAYIKGKFYVSDKITNS